MTWLQGGAR